MATNFLTKIFGSRNDRLLKKYRYTVTKINAMEPALEQLSDDALRGKTQEFKDRLDKGETLDALLPEAFAVVREGSKRVMKLRHFDVQMLGGMSLHNGKISEMGTGEGKTLTATLPVYLNALSGQGVHVVTVNDYLANRDAQWMGKLYNFLGLSVGINLPNMSREEKQAAYRADITYGTNNEYGFDYLRDNMVYEAADRVQRKLNYAIVDEVDSILIDEARTPLIISGQAEDQTDLYQSIKLIVPQLEKQEGEADPHTGEGITKVGDFTIDEKSHQVFLTERGHENAERILFEMGLIPEGASLYDPANITLMHHLYAALRAKHLYLRDQHYVVQAGEVIIVDEFTGRLMTGRRWSEGLHQAVEAKEGVAIQPENQTMASITFQNYFRLYGKLAGMTGTADTEAYEFQEIYGLETVVMPPNKPSRRDDQLDRVYKTTKEKYDAAIADIRECYERGQPVLVGTTSIENSEIIAELLTNAKLPHQVLNAKQHAREADIVAQAGSAKVITIATNMAGRGTDIKLAEGVADLGGLHILGTGRHESRRIDNQLRGRSGRQGDPGSSRFYLSLEDDLLRIFGSDRIAGIMDKLGMEEDEPIEHNMISKAIENAQRKVEGHNFDIRKHLLEYDDVMNMQRGVIYKQRREVLGSESVKSIIDDMLVDLCGDVTRELCDEKFTSEEWEWDLIHERVLASIGVVMHWEESERAGLKAADFEEKLLQIARAAYAAKEEEVGEANMRHLERVILLQIVDTFWKDHLLSMDHLKEGIGLRGYGQKNPLDEYKKEGYKMFTELMQRVKEKTVSTLLRVQLARPEEMEEMEAERRRKQQEMEMRRSDEQQPADKKKQPHRQAQKVGRNSPCPCGSGKKYKKCCGETE